MRKLISILLALLFINSISNPEQKDIIKDADLMLDMMEYESAIIYYLKILSQNPEQGDIRKHTGYAYFQLEKIDEALRFLKEEFTLFPDNGDAYDLLVYILFELNKLKEANKFLERLDFPIRLTEDNPYIGGLGWFIFGTHFKETKEYDKAKKYFRKALDRGHDPVKCHVQLIDIDLIRGKLEFVREDLADAIRLYGSQPDFYYMNGLRCFEKSKTHNQFPFSSIIESFEKALELNPYFKDALFNSASLSYNYSDFRKASEYFERILEIEPENEEIKFYLDCSLKKLNKSIYIQSLSECPQMINLSREFIEKSEREYKYKFKNDINYVLENINYMGLEFIRRGKLHDALRRFRNGLKIYPESPEINFNTGMVFYWLNLLKEAEKHALIALRQRGFFGMLPTYIKQKIKKAGGYRPEKREYLGFDTYRTDNISRRKAGSIHEIPFSNWTLEVALKEGNYFLEAYDLLGNIYFKEKDYHRSILAFRKVIEINPEDAMGHYNLGCAYSALKDWENAEKEWKQAVKSEKESTRIQEREKISNDQLEISLIVLKRPVSFRAHKSLGKLYLVKNLPDEAVKEFEVAIELEPGDPEPYYELGKIYQAKSEANKKYNEKAIFYYEKYLYLGGKKEAEVKQSLKSLK